MHLPTLSLLGTSLLLSTCSAASIISPPDRWIRYDLEVPADMTPDVSISKVDTADDSLVKRQQVKVCQALGAAASCIGMGDSVHQICDGIARKIKDLSNERDCGTVAGSIGSVTYRYHSEGQNCDTTAAQYTIAGAIEYHIKHVNNVKLCQTECLDLTHGGTWNGYLLIGPSNGFDSSKYCGPKLGFGNCDAGGKKDFN
jgi:hypothetical protein